MSRPAQEYMDWIKAYHAERGGSGYAQLRGQCANAAARMVLSFPELRVVKGHVFVPLWGTREQHWWLEAPDGSVVDPTEGQFSAGIVLREEYRDGDALRVGRCMNCGDDILAFSFDEAMRGKRPFCSDECAAECFGEGVAP